MDERERQYQEYLSLREKKPPEEDKYTYGESEMRRIYQEKAHRERVEAVRERIKQGEREQYLAARDHEHHEHHERKESFETPVRANRAERNKRKSRSERRSAFEKKAKAEKDHIKEGARQRIQELKSEVDLGAVFEKDTDGKRRRPKAGRGKRTVRRLTLVLLLLAILAAGGVLMAFASIMSMEDVDIDKNAIAINPEVATQLDNGLNEDGSYRFVHCTVEGDIENSEEYKAVQGAFDYNGPVLTRSRGTITGPSGKETYYNLNMSGCINIMSGRGFHEPYWVRSDGVKMYGYYVMCAAGLSIRPKGSIVESSNGLAIVVDTGGFASRNPSQLDIAVSW